MNLIMHIHIVNIFIGHVIVFQKTGEGVVYAFNPITGQPLDGVMKLGYRIKQSMLLQVTTDDFLRGILIFDTRDKAYVYPESATAIAASLAKNTYIFTADQTTGILSGFSLSYSTAQVCMALDMMLYSCYFRAVTNFNFTL